MGGDLLLMKRCVRRGLSVRGNWTRIVHVTCFPIGAWPVRLSDGDGNAEPLPDEGARSVQNAKARCEGNGHRTL